MSRVLRWLYMGLLVLVLSSCGLVHPPSPSPHSGIWLSSYFGVSIDIYIVPEVSRAQGDTREYWGRAQYYFNGCVIQLDDYLLEYDKFFTRLLAHEIYHCLDWFLLDYDHNGIEDEGCRFGTYYCKPSEGYAEFGERAYLEKCWVDGSTKDDLLLGGVECPLPHPRTIVPPPL